MKQAIAACALAAILLLTGCNAAKEQLGQFFLERAGVTQREESLRYEQYRDAGKLDESGQYIMPEEQTDEIFGIDMPAVTADNTKKEETT